MVGLAAVFSLDVRDQDWDVNHIAVVVDEEKFEEIVGVPVLIQLQAVNQLRQIKLALGFHSVADVIDPVHFFRRQLADEQLVRQVFEAIKAAINVVLRQLQIQTVPNAKLVIDFMEADSELDPIVGLDHLSGRSLVVDPGYTSFEAIVWVERVRLRQIRPHCDLLVELAGH